MFLLSALERDAAGGLAEVRAAAGRAAAPRLPGDGPPGLPPQQAPLEHRALRRLAAGPDDHRHGRGLLRPRRREAPARDARAAGLVERRLHKPRARRASRRGRGDTRSPASAWPGASTSRQRKNSIAVGRLPSWRLTPYRSVASTRSRWASARASRSATTAGGPGAANLGGRRRAIRETGRLERCVPGSEPARERVPVRQQPGPRQRDTRRSGDRRAGSRSVCRPSLERCDVLGPSVALRLPRRQLVRGRLVAPGGS